MANMDNAFMEGLEKLSGILTGVAGELERFAESFETSEEELADPNAGKTREEIELEDVIAARIASPLVTALDGISGILNGATAKIMEMSAESSGSSAKVNR